MSPSTSTSFLFLSLPPSLPPSLSLYLSPHRYICYYYIGIVCTSHMIDIRLTFNIPLSFPFPNRYMSISPLPLLLPTPNRSHDCAPPPQIHRPTPLQPQPPPCPLPPIPASVSSSIIERCSIASDSHSRR